MRTSGARERFLKEEGFTLPEMLVTIVIMMVVFFALYGVFDTSVRVFAFGSNKVEAVESARLGLERMEREVRAAYQVGSDGHLFFTADGTAASNPPQAMPSQTQITFGNELGAEGEGDGEIECGAPCEYITYKLTDDVAGSSAECIESPCDLRRVNTLNSGDPGSPVVDNAVFPGGLDFTYLQSDGITLATNESNIAKVRVSLEIMVDPGSQNAASQRLTTEIDLRNRQ